MSGQLKRLKSEQAELLKTFDSHLIDVKGHLAQNYTVYADRAYRCFFEIDDDLEKNRQQSRQHLKPKYLDSFDADTERNVGEKMKTQKDSQTNSKPWRN